jgi:hypothetical protein
VAATNGLRRGAGVAVIPLLLLLPRCTSIDPGADFVVPQTVFDANYFYCHVEPGIIFGPSYMCGAGDPTKGDPNNGCHFNPAAVSGMALINHTPIDCGGGDIPLDPTTVAEGSPAQSNLGACSLEMSTDYTTAAMYTRPSSLNGVPPAAHPRPIFAQGDPTIVMLLSTWASK